MSDVQACAGELRELHVARNADGFSSGRHARQAEPRGGQAFAHYRAGGERNVFGEFDYRQIERAAARVAVSMVSEDSCPGSRRCAWRSTKPGATIRPVASNTCAPLGEIFPVGARSVICSPSRRTSRGASVFRAGSMTRPFLIKSI